MGPSTYMMYFGHTQYTIVVMEEYPVNTVVGLPCQSKSQTSTQPSQLTNNAQLSTENLTSTVCITLDHLCLV